MHELAERFSAKIEVYEDPRTPAGLGACWLWRGCLDRDGYGAVKLDGAKRRTHRVVYQLLEGEIPEGMDLDHQCHSRSCCNPAHLEPVTRTINSQRANARRWGK